MHLPRAVVTIFITLAAQNVFAAYGVRAEDFLVPCEALVIDEFSRAPLDNHMGLVTTIYRVPMTADNVILAYMRGLYFSGGSWLSLPQHSVMDFTGPLAFKPNNGDPAFLRNAHKKGFTKTRDTAFRQVVKEAALMPRKDGNNWINSEHRQVYQELFERKFAHSFEVWQNGELVAGLFGILVGKVFRIESMFHKVDNAGKLAVMDCIEWQKEQGLTFMDTMRGTSLLLNGWGAYLIPREEFLRRIEAARNAPEQNSAHAENQ